MTVIGEQVPEESGGERLLAAIEEVDYAQSDLLDASSVYAKRPIQANAERVVECASQVAKAVGSFTECVLEDKVANNEQKGTIIANIYTDNDESRASHFNKLFQGKLDAPFAIGDVKDVIAETITGSLNWIQSSVPDEDEDHEEYLTAEADDLSSNLIDQYRHNLGVDINKLFKCGDKSYRARMLRAGQVAGKHSLDILKISSAVVVGTLVAEFIRRQQDQ